MKKSKKCAKKCDERVKVRNVQKNKKASTRTGDKKTGSRKRVGVCLVYLRGVYGRFEEQDGIGLCRGQQHQQLYQ